MVVMLLIEVKVRIDSKAKDAEAMVKCDTLILDAKK